MIAKPATGTILFLMILVCTNALNGQSIEVTSQQATFSTGEQSALTTTVYKNTKKEVVAAWKDFLKGYQNEKVKFSDDEMFGDNILIKEWGNNPVDIYTRFEENKKDNSVKMLVAFDLGGAYLSAARDADKYASAQKMLKDFAVKTTRIPMEENLKDAQKHLDNMDSDQKELKKENKSLHDDIDDYRKKIDKAQDKIKKNEEEQAERKAEVEKQRSVVEKLKSEMDAVK